LVSDLGYDVNEYSRMLILAYSIHLNNQQDEVFHKKQT